MNDSIDERVFGNNGMTVLPWACQLKQEEGMDHYFEQVLNKPFDRKRFRRAGVFRFLWELTDTKAFSNHNGMRCLDMPIKMPGTGYRLPGEFKQWKEAIVIASAHQHVHNNEIEKFYAYLTIDQKPVLPNASQRKPGLHVDGYQGTRISPKVACDRSYVCFDNTPMIIHNQSFNIEDLDDSKVNIFHKFDQLAHESSIITPPVNTVIFMDCYTVHGTTLHKSSTLLFRTFFRLTYSVRQFDRLGNSHNNLFDYNWKMVERSIHTGLSSPQ